MLALFVANLLFALFIFQFFIYFIQWMYIDDSVSTKAIEFQLHIKRAGSGWFRLFHMFLITTVAKIYFLSLHYLTRNSESFYGFSEATTSSSSLNIPWVLTFSSTNSALYISLITFLLVLIDTLICLHLTYNIRGTHIIWDSIIPYGIFFSEHRRYAGAPGISLIKAARILVTYGQLIWIMFLISNYIPFDLQNWSLIWQKSTLFIFLFFSFGGIALRNYLQAMAYQEEYMNMNIKLATAFWYRYRDIMCYYVIGSYCFIFFSFIGLWIYCPKFASTTLKLAYFLSTGHYSWPTWIKIPGFVRLAEPILLQEALYFAFSYLFLIYWLTFLCYFFAFCFLLKTVVATHIFNINHSSYREREFYRKQLLQANGLTTKQIYDLEIAWYQDVHGFTEAEATQLLEKSTGAQIEMRRYLKLTQQNKITPEQAQVLLSIVEQKEITEKLIEYSANLTKRLEQKGCLPHLIPSIVSVFIREEKIAILELLRKQELLAQGVSLTQIQQIIKDEAKIWKLTQH